MIDYVFPEEKLFPISEPDDILSAIEAYPVFKKIVNYDEFSYRLAKLAQKKGSLFVAKLPTKTKKLIGLHKENRPEADSYKKIAKKPRSHFIRYEED